MSKTSGIFEAAVGFTKRGPNIEPSIPRGAMMTIKQRFYRDTKTSRPQNTSQSLEKVPKSNNNFQSYFGQFSTDFLFEKCFRYTSQRYRKDRTIAKVIGIPKGTHGHAVIRWVTRAAETETLAVVVVAALALWRTMCFSPVKFRNSSKFKF